MNRVTDRDVYVIYSNNDNCNNLLRRLNFSLTLVTFPEVLVD